MFEKFTKKQDIQEQELDTDLMLHDPDTDQVHVLNETAKAVWRLTDGMHTLKDMEKEVRKGFSIIDDDQDVRGNIEGVIEELKGKGLIVGR